MQENADLRRGEERRGEERRERDLGKCSRGHLYAALVGSVDLEVVPVGAV